MTANITAVGTVATEPRLIHFENGGSKTVFRLAESERRLDRASGTWVPGGTSWYTVNASRSFAAHAANSIKKGQRVIVTGRLRVKPWEKQDGKRGIAVEIDAEGLGHDLRFGTSVFTKTDYSAHHTYVEGNAEESERGDFEQEPADGTQTQWSSVENCAEPQNSNTIAGSMSNAGWHAPESPQAKVQSEELNCQTV